MVPDYGFRKPFNAHRTTLAFLATVDGLGYTSYKITPVFGLGDPEPSMQTVPFE
jgi:hypothetical protein